MANKITVTTTTLKSKASDLRTKNRQLKTYISDLKSQESSLNSMWDGEANDAFHKAFMSDIAQMIKFYNAIEKYCQALERIANQYDATEAKNKGRAVERTYKS